MLLLQLLWPLRRSSGDRQQRRQHDAASSGINGTDDLNSYLLAAAAASVHAQQQNNPDERTAASEDSFDSTATPIPNSSIYTNATSVNGAEDDDTRSTIVSQCRRYTEDPTPFPLSIGKRTPGGCAELFQAIPQSAAQTLQTLPLTEATVELGKTRCYWALLSADYSQGNGPTGEKLHFVYLDPVLQQHMAEQAERLVGSDSFTTMCTPRSATAYATTCTRSSRAARFSAA